MGGECYRTDDTTEPWKLALPSKSLSGGMKIGRTVARGMVSLMWVTDGAPMTAWVDWVVKESRDGKRSASYTPDQCGRACPYR